MGNIVLPPSFGIVEGTGGRVREQGLGDFERGSGVFELAEWHGLSFRVAGGRRERCDQLRVLGL